MSRFWAPFVAYADAVEQVVRRNTARDQGRLDERIVTAIARTDQSTNGFRDLVRGRVADVASLDAQTDAIDAAAGGQGPGYVRERKTRLLYGVMIALPDGYRLMYDRGILDQRLYYLHVRGVAMRLRSAAMMGLLLAIVGAVAYATLARDGKRLFETYAVWRIGKPTSTNVDQFRTRRHLVALLTDDAVRDRATEDIAALIRRPGLPTERADLALQILLEAHAAERAEGRLAPLLIQSLRATNIDVRVRVNDVLKLLAGPCHGPRDDSLWNWKPIDADSTTVLEERITLWSEYWRRPRCST